MCAIAGLLARGGTALDPRAIRRMCKVVRHRGPDDAGYLLVSLGTPSGPRGNHWLELTDDEFYHKNVSLAPFESEHAQREIAASTWHLALGHHIRDWSTLVRSIASK